MQCGSCTLLQPGASDASVIEKLADGILFCPSFLWLNRKVTAIHRDNKWEVSYSTPPGSLCCCPDEDFLFPRHPQHSLLRECWPLELPFFCLRLPFNFAFTQLPGMICSAIGMPIKAVVLATDTRAAVYSKLAESCLAHEKLILEKGFIENKIRQNQDLMNFENTRLSILTISKDSLVKLQDDLNNVKEANFLTPLINHMDKQSSMDYLDKNASFLQEKLEKITGKIKECEFQAKELSLEYLNYNNYEKTSRLNVRDDFF